MMTIEKLSVVTPADWIPGPEQGKWTYNDYAAISEDGQFEVVNGVLYAHTIELLVLRDGVYRSLGLFSGDVTIPPVVLPGFSVQVSQFFITL